MKDLRSELLEEGLLQHFTLLKVQLDELADSFTSILGNCKTMENLSHTEIDMDHIKRKVEESEQEKTFLKQKVSQLEAELQKMIHLVVPEEIRNNEQLLNDYLNRLVQNQSCEVERKNACIKKDECLRSSKKDTEISYIENETIQELPSGNKAKRIDSSKLIEKTPSSLNLSYGNKSNPHHNTDIEFHLNIMEPLSPIKSPPRMRKKLSRLKKRKFNTLLVNSASDLNSPLQKDSTSSSSKTLVVPNEYNLKQITAIPFDALSSEYSQLKYTKKMKTGIETIGELNPSSESDAIPSYHAVMVKDGEKHELPLSSNTFNKDGAHLPDSSPKDQLTSSPKSQFINSFKGKLNSVTGATSASEFGKEMYSNSLQINNGRNDVEMGSSCHKSLHILRTINESKSVVTEREVTDNDEISTVPILPNDLMEVHSELSPSERWEIDTVVLSPGSCHDSLEEESSEPLLTLRKESTLLQVKENSKQETGKSIVQNRLTEQPQMEIVTNIETPYRRSFKPDDNSTFLNKSPKSCMMPKKKIARVKNKKLNKQSLVVHNVTKQQSITLLSKNASFLRPPFHLNKYSKSTCNTNSKKVKTSSKLVNLVTAKSNNSSFEDSTDIQSSSITKQNMKSLSQLNQSHKIEFSTSLLKSFSKIEKILNRRRNAKSKTTVRKPKWMAKSKNDNSAIIVNDTSLSKNVPEKESKTQAYSQTSAGVSPIMNKRENIEVTTNSCLEEVPEDISNEEDELGVSNTSKSLSEKKYYNYVRRWKRPVRKNFAKSVPEIIASCFRKIKCSLPFTWKLLSSTKELTEAFKDKTVSPENESIVFYVLKYFSLIEKYNPVRDFKKQQDPSVFLSPFEECVVNVLRDLEKSDECFKDLILLIVVNIRQLILAVNNLSLNGSCAFCRIYTLICKSEANKREAISFCCDILKVNHRYSPMLIATILGVWKDLLDIPYDVAEEEAVFYGSLRLKAQQLPTIKGSRFSGLKISDWESSKCILEKYISASVVRPSVDTVDFLVKSIKEKCIEGTYAKEYLFTTPLVLFAAYRGWYWAKVNIINKYLIPYICNSVDSVKNSRTLTLFCKLYAEISVFYPTSEKPEKVLKELFETGKDDKECKFLQECAAPSLIQLLLSRNNPIPEDLLDWYKENESSPACMFLKFHFNRRSLSDKTDFTEEDIL
ncbi:uncharacterized protein [Parasteatoda tepidariorum]|uniref:uncharacterized protein isoform X1 n=2 Tax=Parasteatoda tepidariorum TaxID=114398 RepID=UPI001C71D78F|nr:uncharacterized protein LOC107439209 isoform X2 [Parasteatoda tepidariorum]